MDGIFRVPVGRFVSKQMFFSGPDFFYGPGGPPGAVTDDFIFSTDILKKIWLDVPTKLDQLGTGIHFLQ